MTSGKGACAQLTILAVLSKHSSPRHDKQLKVVYEGRSVLLIRAGAAGFYSCRWHFEAKSPSARAPLQSARK